jgi:hypothetical protein
VIDDNELGVLGADETRELLDLAGAKQSGRPWVRHWHEAARLDVKIDGSGETDCFIETGLRRSLGRPSPFRGPSPSPLQVENRRQYHRSCAAIFTRARRVAWGSPLLALQLSRVGRTQLISGTFRFGDVCELYGLTRHDGRNGVLVDQLRMSVAAKQHTEIIEPRHDALQFHAVYEKDGQRSLVLANMIEKGVLK